MCEYINGAIIQEDFTMEKTIYDESNGLWYELRGDISEQATEQILLLAKQMAEREGVTEQLKAQDQMLWYSE